MGRAAKSTIDQAFFLALLGNPQLADGPLFQTVLDKKLSASAFNESREKLEFPPSAILVGKQNEGLARTIVNEQYKKQEVEVLASQNLSDQWFLVSNQRPPFTIATLQGHQTPTVQIKQNPLTDNIEFKVSFDFCVVPTNRKGIVKSTGAV